MSTEEFPLPEEEYRLLLAACDEALAAGTPVASVCATPVTPELRPRLEREIAWCQLVRHLLPQAAASGPPSTVGASPPPAAAAPEPVGTHLGRFAIRHELGRGSFGVVFLAYDPRLHREVALKVPRPEALVTPELRARFRHEGQAAASLDHPNLLPVYEAGEEGGVCYLASAYCPGIALDRWLKQRTEPVPYRLAAQLLAALAEAVEHAHRRGVLHRDLKPSNIMLESLPPEPPAGTGPAGDSLPFVPRVTDFGLAKLLDCGPGLSSAACQTQSGAILGTPNYMAPEQGGGQSKRVGPAADVHALGAILYEVLTGRPPFQADTVLDTLLLLRTQEPVPPARLRPNLPRDLETICLQCLRKAPDQRYASARALAEDLRRYLRGEPIQARPLGALERTWRWARRNPKVAGLLLALLLVLSGGLASVTVLWRRAERQRGRAEANFEKVREAVDRMLTRVGQEQLAHAPQLEQVRREILEDALRFYQWFLEQRGSDPAVRQEAGRALRRVGDIHALLGQADQAEQDYGVALGLQEQLAAEFPHEARYRLEVARTRQQAGQLLAQTGKVAEAEQAHRAARYLWQPLADADPGVPAYRQGLAQSLCDLGTLLAATGRWAEAAEVFGRAREYQQGLVADFPAEAAYREDLARSHAGLADLLAQTGRLAEAEAAGRAAQALYQRLADDWPARPAYRLGLGRSCMALGKVLEADGRAPAEVYTAAFALYEKLAADFPNVPDYRLEMAGAIQAMAQVPHASDAEGVPAHRDRVYGQAVALYEKLATQFPRRIDYRQRLAASGMRLAVWQMDTRRPREAEQHFHRSRALFAELIRECPTVPAYRHGLAKVHLNFGILLADTGRAAEAEQGYRDGLDLERQLMAAFPEAPDHENLLGGLQENLAEVLRRRGEVAAACRLLEEAIGHQRALLQRYPRHPTYGRFLAGHYQVLAEARLQQGAHAAAQAAREYHRNSPAAWPFHYRAAVRLLERCLLLAARDDRLPESKRQEQAEAYGAQAVQLLRQDVLAGRMYLDDLQQIAEQSPLRRWADFQGLLSEAKARAQAVPPR
jgi:tetratricopeptide (TPR) repeat protein